MPSSVIASFHYNAAQHALDVVFNSGNVYRYIDVPEDVYVAMKNAFSKGTFLNTQIKPKYRYRKIK